jgi:hypothetical protein
MKGRSALLDNIQPDVGYVSLHRFAAKRSIPQSLFGPGIASLGVPTCLLLFSGLSVNRCHNGYIYYWLSSWICSQGPSRLVNRLFMRPNLTFK